MFIETSFPRKRGDRARLESEVFPPTPSNGRCMQFWYHMNGSHIGTLNVYMRVYGQSESKLWSLSGDQGKAWNSARVSILSGNRYYQVSSSCRTSLSVLLAMDFLVKRGVENPGSPKILTHS